MPKIVRHPLVAHVGTMDASLKNEGSQEGGGLSVSIHPIAWARIHAIGDEGFVLEGPGRFLDALRMTKAERAAVWQWAKDEELVRDATVWTVTYEDDELEEIIEFECETEDEAIAEAEEIFDARVASKPSTVATRKLAELCDQDPERLGPQKLPTGFQYDLVLSLWAERHLGDVDGVWWNEKLQPDAYSAPRGVIFGSRLADWTAHAADLSDLQRFQSGRWIRPEALTIR
jgi:hypothetical protein